MIFTSSSVTSFQDYRLQEKSIQNTSLASGLCSGRMLTSPPRISGSWLSWSGNRTQTIRSKEKRKKRNKEENPSSDVLGPGLEATFSLHTKVECDQAPNLWLLFLCDILQSSQKGGSWPQRWYFFQTQIPSLFIIYLPQTVGTLGIILHGWLI